jgi:hypothetical protein
MHRLTPSSRLQCPRDSEGHTPLDLARAQCPEIVDLLTDLLDAHGGGAEDDTAVRTHTATSQPSSFKPHIMYDLDVI